VNPRYWFAGRGRCIVARARSEEIEPAFVHSSAERIERAKADWRDGAFDRVPGDDERIPPPED
jgi:hypothetical protein